MNPVLRIVNMDITYSNNRMKCLIHDFPGGANLLFDIIFATNYIKMKKKTELVPHLPPFTSKILLCRSTTGRAFDLHSNNGLYCCLM